MRKKPGRAWQPPASPHRIGWQNGSPLAGLAASVLIGLLGTPWNNRSPTCLTREAPRWPAFSWATLTSGRASVVISLNRNRGVLAYSYTMICTPWRAASRLKPFRSNKCTLDTSKIEFRQGSRNSLARC